MRIDKIKKIKSTSPGVSYYSQTPSMTKYLTSCAVSRKLNLLKLLVGIVCYISIKYFFRDNFMLSLVGMGTPIKIDQM